MPNILDQLRDDLLSPLSLLSSVLTILISLAGYILLGLSLSRLSGITGASRPWMAWVPFARLYLLGGVADLYTDNRMTTDTDRADPFYSPSALRRKLLGYGIGSSVTGGLAGLGSLFILAAGAASFFLLLGGLTGGDLPADTSDMASFLPLLLGIGALVVFVAVVLYLVFSICFLTALCPALCRIFTALGIPVPALWVTVSVFVPRLAAILLFAYTRRTEGLRERFLPPEAEAAEPADRCFADTSEIH